MKPIIHNSFYLLTALLICAVGCKRKAQVTPPPPVVEVATVSQADVPIFHEWIGSLDGQIGQTTGALRVEALFPNPSDALRPGQFARIRVKIDMKHDALLVPQRAVSELQGNYQVAVLTSSNTIHIQPVRVGERSGNSWVIEDGLHSGQRVVVEGVQKVRQGLTVITTNFVAQPMPSVATQNK